MDIETTIDPVAECSVLIRFEAEPNHQLSWVIGEISHYLRNKLGHWVMNVTPSFNTILIDYLPHRVSIFEFVHYLENIVTEELLNLRDKPEFECVELPVYYHPDVGPDLPLYYDRGLTLEQVIELHSSKTYTVGAIGFTAGFAFLSEVDDDLHLERKSSPRVKVVKGSVGIANNQTAIYPSESPGGWNIIGNCPVDVYDPNSSKILPFRIGTQITFKPIDLESFLKLGGQITGGWQ